MAEIGFVQASAGEWVPLLDGRALHSTVHPRREAERLVRECLPRLARAETVIVLGLGGGYHVEELARAMPWCERIVIEAEPDLARSVRASSPAVFDQALVLAGEEAGRLPRLPEIQAAMTKPFAFFRHPASVRQRPEYYDGVQRGLTDRTLRGLRTLSERHLGLSAFFRGLDIPLDERLTLPRLEEAILRQAADRGSLSEAAMIWLALRELVK